MVLGVASIIAEFVMSVLTRIKVCTEPSTVVGKKLNRGTPVLLLLNLYCSVGIPSIISFLMGFAYNSVGWHSSVRTFTNCSYQFGFAGSFQIIV